MTEVEYILHLLSNYCLIELLPYELLSLIAL